MSRTEVVLATLVVYKLALLALGWLGRTRTRDASDFYIGGRTLGPWVAALSASASSSSAWTILGVSSAAYAWGLAALWLFPACVGGFALNWYVLAPGLRRLAHEREAVTVTDILAGDGTGASTRALRITASTIILVSLLFYVCSQFQGAGKTFASTFEMDMVTSTLIGAGVVVLYTLLGGFWAASLTDTLQGALMAFTSIALPIAALVAVGGPVALWDGLASLADAGMLDPWHGASGVAAVGFVAGLLGIGLGYPGQPHVVNRLMALRNERAVVIARRVAMGWSVLVYAGMLLLGFCGRLLFPLEDSETLFMVATNALFPPVVAGVMLAAVLSAIMSTADSQLLVAGSCVTHDLAPRRASAESGGTSEMRAASAGGATSASSASHASHASDRGLLLRSRLVVLLLSAGAVALAVTTDETIFRRVLFAWGAMGAAFGPPLLVTVLRGPLRPGRVVLAMLCGAGLSAAASSGLIADPLRLWERVLPFALSLAIVLAPGARATATSPRR